MTLTEKLAKLDKELEAKIEKGEVQVCNTENPEECVGCGS